MIYFYISVLVIIKFHRQGENLFLNEIFDEIMYSFSYVDI
jgi:hypothetical protein